MCTWSSRFPRYDAKKKQVVCPSERPVKTSNCVVFACDVHVRGVWVSLCLRALACVFLLQSVKRNPKTSHSQPWKIRDWRFFCTRESYLAQVLTPCRDHGNFIWPFLFILPNSSMTSWPTWKKQRLTLTSSQLELRFYQTPLRKSVNELTAQHRAAELSLEQSNRSAYMQGQAGACPTYHLWACRVP
jgi:hypothetical protein